jgi:hypothetical protein
MADGGEEILGGGEIIMMTPAGSGPAVVGFGFANKESQRGWRGQPPLVGRSIGEK